MRKALNIALIVLLWINGLAGIICGITILNSLTYATALKVFLLPGILLFILLGVANIAMTFFIKRHTVLLTSCAIIQGVPLLFAPFEQAETLHYLSLFPLLLAGEGFALIVTALFVISIGPAKEDPYIR